MKLLVILFLLTSKSFFFFFQILCIVNQLVISYIIKKVIFLLCQTFDQSIKNISYLLVTYCFCNRWFTAWKCTGEYSHLLLSGK